MTDARFPERCLTDRRLLRLTADEFRSHTMATIWAVSNRTEGRLEPGDVMLIPCFNTGTINALVRSGLWTEEDGGWQLVDFARDQSSRDELERLERARRADREKKARQRAERNGTPVVPRDRPGDTSRGPSPATAQAGQDRQGQAEQAGATGWNVAVPGQGRKAS